MIKRTIKQNPLTDGVVRIYSVENTADPGDMPVPTPTIKHTLRYRERTVGIKRYYTALQNDVKVDILLRVPCMRDVSTQDIAVLHNGQTYRINQVQYPEGIVPPVMDLSLTRLEVDYSFT